MFKICYLIFVVFCFSFRFASDFVYYLQHSPHSLPCSSGKTPLEMAVEGNKRDVVALREWH
jgi:hypothetical protein